MAFKFFKPWTWFSSKERKEALELIGELSTNLKTIAEHISAAPKRPFKSIRLIGSTLIVVLNDGLILSKGSQTENDVKTIAAYTTEDQILSYFTTKTSIIGTDKTVEEEKEKDIIKKNWGVLDNNEDFEFQGEDVYLAGVDLPLPPVVAGSFIEVLERLKALDNQASLFAPEITEVDEYEKLEDKYLALKMFWLKLALNPLKQSREDLLNFVKVNDVQITRTGNLVLYRRIVSQVDKKLSGLPEFVSSEYFRIKKYKKSPKNYWVYQTVDGKFVSVHGDKVAPDGSKPVDDNSTLYDLYADLPNIKKNSYTSWHNQGKHEIKLGSVYYIDDSEVDLDNGVCASGGLHAAAVDYDYSSYGDTAVVVLVSPSKAITVPTGDIGKIRVNEMFVACVNDREKGVHFADGSLVVFDEEYNNIEIRTLEEAARNRSFDELTVKGNTPAVNFSTLDTIVKQLRERVVEVV